MIHQFFKWISQELTKKGIYNNDFSELFLRIFKENQNQDALNCWPTTVICY